MRQALTSNGSDRRSQLPAPALTRDLVTKVQNAFAPQTGAQRRQAAMEDDPGIRLRHPQGPRHLAMAEAGEVMQHDGLALPPRQPRHMAQDAAGHLRLQDVGFGPVWSGEVLGLNQRGE